MIVDVPMRIRESNTQVTVLVVEIRLRVLYSPDRTKQWINGHQHPPQPTTHALQPRIAIKRRALCMLVQQSWIFAVWIVVIILQAELVRVHVMGPASSWHFEPPTQVLANEPLPQPETGLVERTFGLASACHCSGVGGIVLPSPF
jgi:hypothetical protein